MLCAQVSLILSCRVVSCRVLPCLCLVVFWSLPCPVSCLVWSHPLSFAFSCLVLCLVLSCALSCLVPCLALFCTLSCLASCIFCLVLSCTMSCLVLSLVLSCLVLLLSLPRRKGQKRRAPPRLPWHVLPSHRSRFSCLGLCLCLVFVSSLSCLCLCLCLCLFFLPCLCLVFILSICHRLSSGFVAQGGDITADNGRSVVLLLSYGVPHFLFSHWVLDFLFLIGPLSLVSGGYSIYGEHFNDENFTLRCCLSLSLLLALISNLFGPSGRVVSCSV